MQTPGKSVMDVVVALIGFAGFFVGALGAFIGVYIKLKKDAEIMRLTVQANAEIAQHVNEKDMAIANMRVRQDLEIVYDQELRNARIRQYTLLIKRMHSLAKYPDPGDMTYDDAQKLAEGFRDWYFDGGGLFMSEKTRETYFDLQDGLKIVLQKHHDKWRIGESTLSRSEERRVGKEC